MGCGDLSYDLYFFGRCCNYFVDVWDAKISMQCLVVDIPWGVCDQSQCF